MLIIGVIPARFASVRFPGKPLAPLAGKPMVLHVWEAACSAKRLDRVVVATDDERIADCVRKAGGEARMTSAEARSGTDRVAEVARSLPADAYVNLQGDEPLMPGQNVDRAVDTLLAGAGRGIATLVIPASAAGRRRSEHREGGRGRGRARALLLAFADPLLSQRLARVREASRHLRVPGERPRGDREHCRRRRSSAPSRSSSFAGSSRDIRSG